MIICAAIKNTRTGTANQSKESENKPKMQNENYFIPINPSINPASFTSCTGTDCSRKN